MNKECPLSDVTYVYIKINRQGSYSNDYQGFPCVHLFVAPPHN